MKKIIATAALLLLPLSAQAAEGEFIWIEGTPIIADHSGDNFGLKYATVGNYFNIQLRSGELTSVEIPSGAVGWTLFEDASMEFRYPAPVYDVATTPRSKPVRVAPPLPTSGGWSYPL